MKYFVVTEDTIYNDIFCVMFQDAVNEGDTNIINKYVMTSNKILNKICSIIYSRKFDSILKGKFDFILKKYFVLRNELKQSSEKSVVIFTNASLQKFYNKRRLLEIKKEFSNNYFVLLLVDSSFQSQAQEAIRLSGENIFDLIYSYDKKDCEKYGYIYYPTPYSCLPIHKSIKKKDVYFCGAEKGRTDLLCQVARRLKNIDIEYTFEVIGDSKNSNEFFQVSNSHPRKYTEILKETLSHDCILDLMQISKKSNMPGGLSLRVIESYAYKKRLISNNSQLLNFKYYDPSYMHYIETPDEIDPRWFQDPVLSNDMKNELTPIKFLENISNRLLYE